MKMNVIRGEGLEKMHNQIEKEYKQMLLDNPKRTKKSILEELSEKFGYSNSQSLRNLLTKRNSI